MGQFFFHYLLYNVLSLHIVKSSIFGCMALLTLRIARTTLDFPACTATVLMVVVEGGISDTSVMSEVMSDTLSDIVACLF